MSGSAESEDQDVVHLNPDGHTGRVCLDFDDRDIHAILSEVDEEALAAFASHAFKIGVIALRDTATIGKADYVDRAFERLQETMREALERVFGEEGRLNREFESSLGSDGKLPRALEDVFGESGHLRRELERQFGEDGGRLFQLLNPDDENTVLGRFRRRLEEKFDPEREGSFLANLKEQLRDEFETIRRGLGIEEARAEEREKGHLKGFDFEALVEPLLHACADPFGDRIERTGAESGHLGDDKTGDFVSTIVDGTSPAANRSIVFEVKDKGVTFKGKGSFYKELDRAMENRGSVFAIGVVEAEHAAAFAPLQYVSPDKLLVAVDGDAPSGLELTLAYRVARMLVEARFASRESGISTAAIDGALTRIASQLELLRATRRQITTIDNASSKIRTNLEEMERGIEEAINEIRDLLGEEEGEE